MIAGLRRAADTRSSARSADTTLVRARPRRVRVPVLVVGAERDGFFTSAELRRTAAAYGTEAELLAGIGHDLMLDQGWPQVADRIHTWIRGLPSRERRGSGDRLRSRPREPSPRRGRR